MPGHVDAVRVVWFPPEQLGRLVGEYREHLGDVDEGGRITPEWGALVQWVDDAPNDSANGAGHFEVYDGDPAAYVPQRSA